MTEGTVEFANRHSRAGRMVLALIGLGVIIWPIWDLWPGIASISVVSPFFWIIGLGAVAVGGILFVGSVFGWSTVLTVAPDGVMLQRENLFQRQVAPVNPTDLGAIRIEEQEWSDGPMTWHVSLTLTGSKPLRSESFQTRATAEALAARLKLALGRTAD
jgi:hypothetical protein